MKIAEFTDHERLGAATVSPDGTRVGYVSDQAGSFALWVRPLDGAGSPARRWDSDAGAAGCVWRPDGRRILVTADRAGTENYQLAEVDPDDGSVLWLTDAGAVRHEIGMPYGSGTQPYSPDSTRLAYSSNARDVTAFDVIVRDLVTGAERTVLLGDDRYYPMLWSPDGGRLLVQRLHQNTEHDLFVCDVDSGEVRHVTSHTGWAKYRPLAWSVDGRGCYLLTSEGREFVGLAFLDLTASGALQWIATPSHDIDAAAVSADESRLVWVLNEDGFSRLQVRDLRTGAERSVDGLPPGVLAMDGGYDGFWPSLTADGRQLVALLERATGPKELYVIDVEHRSGHRQLTRCGARVPDGLVEPELVRFPGGDGFTVPALLYRPDEANGERPVPVVVSIHGGPEAQEMPTWSYTGCLYQYLLAHGIGVLAPNVRGSTGFGMTYQRAIYRAWGDGDVRDFAGCVTFLRGLDWADGDRLGVFGASYGGFAALSCLSRLPDAWQAGVELFGPSDLEAFARTMPPYWRRRAPEWVGDPDTEAELLRARSPVTHVDDIQAPLLVIQGANDARVAQEASDVVVDRLRELDRAVEYVVISGEGHGFGSRKNYVEVMSRSADWLLSHLRG